MVRPERRIVLAGESLVRVSAEAPGSRLQPSGEIRPSRAECREPLKEREANKVRQLQVRLWMCAKRSKTRRLRLRDRVRELTDARRSGKDVKQSVAELNPVLRGWGNYFRTGNADREFNKMDGFVYRRLHRWQNRRGGQRATRRRSWTGDQLHGMGLYKLQGTVRCPSQATSGRSSVSCVPENGTHSLKGGYMETGQQ
jgi:hypothetical protein